MKIFREATLYVEKAINLYLFVFSLVLGEKYD
ncbi:hypothetical protein Igag_0307 [Ignisphaera aggregans DSM 17230]|uniref:Uncharacterized protein n=1 Tax=Ignisphaera aggregans (strain DSM 17230 / JCM 13409 / AQ1.S1) TaxID=583356 RepID=E0SQS9_IGNAA|nr:hypothetical protein Igag_0307 [Ignisphaera aggregans DSM 17230]